MPRSLFVFFAFAPVLSFAQVTSVQDGLYSDPATWSCNCVPQGPDDITINHAVVLDMDLFPGGDALVDINPGASLIENDPYQITLVYAIFRNKGTLNVSGLISTAPFCDFWNYGQATISSWLVNASGAFFNNTGTCTTHHLENYGVLFNSGSATLQADLVDNYNDIHNSSLLVADSVYTSYLFVNGGTCEAGAFVNGAGYFNSSNGTLNVSGNATIGGESYQWEDSRLNVDGNLVLAGTIHYVGQAMVLGDLYIDTITVLDGTGGICVGGTSHNAGTVSEIYFCDATGNDFDMNTGTIAPDVVYCAGSVCELGMEEVHLQLSIAPNPASGIFSVSAAVPVESVQLYAITGELVLSVPASQIAVYGFAPGMYFVGINGVTTGLQRLMIHQ